MACLSKHIVLVSVRAVSLTCVVRCDGISAERIRPHGDGLHVLRIYTGAMTTKMIERGLRDRTHEKLVDQAMRPTYPALPVDPAVSVPPLTCRPFPASVGKNKHLRTDAFGKIMCAHSWRLRRRGVGRTGHSSYASAAPVVQCRTLWKTPATPSITPSHASASIYLFLARGPQEQRGCAPSIAGRSGTAKRVIVFPCGVPGTAKACITGRDRRSKIYSDHNPQLD